MSVWNAVAADGVIFGAQDGNVDLSVVYLRGADVALRGRDVEPAEGHCRGTVKEHSRSDSEQGLSVVLAHLRAKYFSESHKKTYVRSLCAHVATEMKAVYLREAQIYP